MKYLITVSITLCLPLLAYAEFKPFQTLPGLQNAGNLTTQQYIDALYVIAIAAASILAVLKLMWAGAQYMLSEVVTKKEDAKKDIRGAILGLLIILAAVTILNTINPNLTQINFLRNAAPVVPIQGSGTPVSGVSGKVTAGAMSCKEGETLNKTVIADTGEILGTCVPTNPDAPKSGDAIRHPEYGSGGKQSYIMDGFGSMEAFRTWCASVGGIVVSEEDLSPPIYTCRYP